LKLAARRNQVRPAVSVEIGNAELGHETAARNLRDDPLGTEAG